MKVESWNPKRDGELNEANMRLKLAELGYLTSRTVYKPGKEVCYPKSKVEKMSSLLTGRFRVRLRGKTIFLGAGDRLSLPKGVRHKAKVIGDQEVVSLEATRSGS